METNHKRWCAMLTLVLLGPLFTGTAAAGSMPMKACELVTAKDVETILGSGFAPQDLLDNEIMSTCAYVGVVGVVGVTLAREYLSAAQSLQIQQAGFKQQGIQVTPVSGLGESAYYLIDPENHVVLNFGKGNLRVILMVESGGKPNIEAALKLARMAYPRLK